MAVRFPLYWDRSNDSMKAITEAQRQELVQASIYEWATDPSVVLTRVNSGGNLGTITDTRKKASATATSGGHDVTGKSGSASWGHQRYGEPVTWGNAGNVSDDYDEPAQLGDVTVPYDHINQTVTTDSNPTLARPVYWDNGIKHMTQADLQDTFIKPAIDILVDGDDRAGTYRIHTSATLSGHSSVSGSIVFRDTSADISEYNTVLHLQNSDNTSETLDQPETVNNYYLLKTDNISSPTHKGLIMAYADGNLREYAPAKLRALLKAEIRYAAAALTDYKIRYGYTGGSLNFSGQNKGSNMVDKGYNGEGIASSYHPGPDEYKTQRHPAGSRVTVNTYKLRIRKEYINRC